MAMITGGVHVGWGATGIPGLTTWSAVFSISLTAVMGRRDPVAAAPITLE